MKPIKQRKVGKMYVAPVCDQPLYCVRSSRNQGSLYDAARCSVFPCVRADLIKIVMGLRAWSWVAQNFVQEQNEIIPNFSRQFLTSYYFRNIKNGDNILGKPSLTNIIDFVFLLKYGVHRFRIS